MPTISPELGVSFSEDERATLERARSILMQGASFLSSMRELLAPRDPDPMPTQQGSLERDLLSTAEGIELLLVPGGYAVRERGGKERS